MNEYIIINKINEVIDKNIILNQKLFKLSYFKIKIFFYIFFILFFFLIQRIYFLEKKNINNSKPKISIFLPIYNKGKYLNRSIGSIQKQTLKNLEIVAINDGSSDNSLKILQEIALKDERIKIINNENNRGSLFSRAIGILNSRGEYLMNLDPDDELHGVNSLKYLYNKAKRYNVDMISFVILYMSKRNRIGPFSSCNRIIKQPELFNSGFRNDLLIDYYITNKLIKKNLFIKAYNVFKKMIYGKKWHYHEDNIWSILILKYANTSIFLNRVMYYYHTNNDSAMTNRYNELEMKNLIYKYDMYKEIFNSPNEEKYLIAGYYDLFYNFEINVNITKKNIEIKNMIIKKMKEFINNYKVSEDILKRIKSFLNSITLL